MAHKQAQHILVGETIGFDDGESDALDEYLVTEVIHGVTELWLQPFTALRYTALEDGRVGEYKCHPEIEIFVSQPVKGN